jgi:hypothetical protein
MSESTPYDYRCPNLECQAEYVAVQRTDASTPFLAMQKGRYIQYEAAWPVTLAPPDLA